jgi:hypothetical protein
MTRLIDSSLASGLVRGSCVTAVLRMAGTRLVYYGHVPRAIRVIESEKHMPTPGAVPANLYQGSRSEYLAQYVFSMFGTATLVPHQEDYGLDLFCTLTRREGQRAEPYAYYAVQVKSSSDPWTFDTPGSVKWILQYPAPLLFCVVDKMAACFTVYQLVARFQSALMPELPTSLILVPSDPGRTDATHRPRVGWDTDNRLQLGPPILQFTVDELLNDETYRLTGAVLDYWVVNDLRNILRQQMGMLAASGPSDYATNEVPPLSGFGTFSMTVIPPEVRELAGKTAAEHLNWLGQVMLASGDLTGALLAALMVRHLYPEGDPERRSGRRRDTAITDVLRISLTSAREGALRKRTRPAAQYRVVLPGGEPLPAGTQVIGRGSRLHFLTGTSWYQLGMDDIPARSRGAQRRISLIHVRARPELV